LVGWEVGWGLGMRVDARGARLAHAYILAGVDRNVPPVNTERFYAHCVCGCVSGWTCECVWVYRVAVSEVRVGL